MQWRCAGRRLAPRVRHPVPSWDSRPAAATATATAADGWWRDGVRGGAPGHVPDVLLSALRASAVRPGAFRLGLAGALLLAVPDLLRQLPVRDGQGGLPAALLVDVVGVLTATAVQLTLVGLVNGTGAASGPGLVLAALRRRPGVVVAGLTAAGAVSALLTLVPSVALLGLGQVVGPLQGPPLSHLLLAQASDVVATAVTAPWFALLVGLVATEPFRR